LEEEAQAEAALTQSARTADATDRPRRGQPPQPPRSVPDPTAPRNFTDPESRITPAPNAKGSVLQGYNGQAAVDATAQIVVAADVTDASKDKQQAQPLLTQVLVMSEQVPRTGSMDAGYFSAANVTALADLGCEPLIPPDRQTHGHALPTGPPRPAPRGVVGGEQMRRTLQTKRGRRLYARRKAIVEPVFGPIKQGRGFRQFLLRGLRQVRGEWALICTTHNRLKLWRALRPRHGRPGAELRALSGSRTSARRA
jgi:hypothetical protein